MKITLKTPKVGNYLGKMTVGHSLAGQDIFTIEAINRVLVGADEQRSDDPEGFMNFIWDEANKPAEKEWQAEPFDAATVKAWQACCAAKHTVLGLAVLRQARAERVLAYHATTAVFDKKFVEDIAKIKADYVSESLEMGLYIAGKAADETLWQPYKAIGEKLLQETLDAYWYHVEGLHIPYAVEADLLYVGQYLLCKGYAIKVVEKLLHDKVHSTVFLNVGQEIMDAVEMDRFHFMTKQFQLACIWLTGYKNGQMGLSKRDENEAYNEIVYGAMT